jgi:hypothetical protein
VAVSERLATLRRIRLRSPQARSGQAEAKVGKVCPEPPFAKGRLVAAKPCVSRAKTDGAQRSRQGHVRRRSKWSVKNAG